MREGRLAGQVAVVTGSTSGIGEAVARQFAAEGASIVINSSQSESEGNRIAGELPSALYVRGDISDPTACERIISAAVAAFGTIDVLVNNAGTTEFIPHTDLDAVTDEIWSRILDVNVLGTWRLSKLAVPVMRNSGRGSIINISSIAGIRAVGSSIPYAVSKAAINHLTMLMARAVGPEIRVNAVAPGPIETPWTADWDEMHADVRKRAPLQRSGLPNEVADACLSLLLSEFVTGQVLVVDGGLSIVS